MMVCFGDVAGGGMAGALRLSDSSPFGAGDFSIAILGTGDAAKILGIPIWRLQKYLDSRQFQLSPEGMLGQGRGSRRAFKIRDIYRVAITMRLVQDGFSPLFIGKMMEHLEHYAGAFDEVRHDHEGNELPPYRFLTFRRGVKGAELHLFPSIEKIIERVKLGDQHALYYILDMWSVTKVVDDRIAKLTKQRE